MPLPISGVESVSPAFTVPTLPSVSLSSVDEGKSFAHSVTGAVDGLREMQSESNRLAVAAVTGDLNDIHSAMIASTRASVTLELVAAVRNKGVEAFNEIMRMQA
ncbi:flagellar hook-basal body complex protein FliE [Microbacterium sp. 77mftsu3.1]|uniref:flagellar hook-basal body complex protein FliE n=1 Tax=Microbacterium sp. 77mftsu3.1 TaxID=1761802 RepID=UPI00037E4BD2|nr:flagellar hook-basal body complex protein FliE [Microbacterium sp. 77mftsu3.1]SDH36653.1 flagellar hook-basal body complex protein FliE [Microbacterium sp. 77mftsu3.1]